MKQVLKVANQISLDTKLSIQRALKFSDFSHTNEGKGLQSFLFSLQNELPQFIKRISWEQLSKQKLALLNSTFLDTSHGERLLYILDSFQDAAVKDGIKESIVFAYTMAETYGEAD